MSWDQLKTILDQAREERANAASEPPVACPIDGEILDVNSRGVRSCPMGNYRWDGVSNPSPPRA